MYIICRMVISIGSGEYNFKLCGQRSVIQKTTFEQRFEGDIRPNYAVKWEKNIPGRGKDQYKGLNVRACLFEEQKNICVAGGEQVGGIK